MARTTGDAPSTAYLMLQKPEKGFVAAYFVSALVAIETWLEGERDQLALWLPVGLGTGIALWFWIPSREGWAAAILAAFAIALCGVALGLFRRIGRALFWFGLMTAFGVMLIGVRAHWVAAPMLARPVVASFEARIDRAERLPARGIVRITVSPSPEASLPPVIRVNVDELDPVARDLLPGARVKMRARIMPPPEATVPGAYDFARLAWFQGIGGTGRTLGPVEIVKSAERGWGHDLRDRLTDHVRTAVPGAPGTIAATLVTGDRGAISEEDAEAMRRSGLAHLLSISGLHVTAVVGAAMLLVLKLLALSPRLALNWPLMTISAAAGALAGIGYTLLTGAEVPTIRSCIAALLILGGLALGREAITLRLIATGALFVLLLWPESLVGPSFQMSFAAVTALVAIHEHPRLRAMLMRREEGISLRVVRGLFGLLLTGLVIEIALMPIALYHFHKAGVYGALANIAAIPLTTFVIMPLEALALLFDIIGLGAPFWWLTGKALTVLLAIAHGVAASPGATLGMPVTPTGAFALMMAGGIWICLWRGRVRWIGIFPAVVGAIWAISAPTPDLLVTGDGKHLALLADDGRHALLRPRAGDYVRSALGESAGFEGEMAALDDIREAQCTPDACAATVYRGGRQWRIMAVRSGYYVPRNELQPACAAADIAVADRRLPSWCRPRWLKADATLLRETGGLSISLAPVRIVSVKPVAGDHPWQRATVPVGLGGQ